MQHAYIRFGCVFVCVRVAMCAKQLRLKYCMCQKLLVYMTIHKHITGVSLIDLFCVSFCRFCYPFSSQPAVVIPLIQSHPFSFLLSLCVSSPFFLSPSFFLCILLYNMNAINITFWSVCPTQLFAYINYNMSQV